MSRMLTDEDVMAVARAVAMVMAGRQPAAAGAMWITKSAAAARIGVSRGTLRMMAAEGQVETRRVGGRMMVSVASIERLSSGARAGSREDVAARAKAAGAAAVAAG
jgi:hypothetical protein